MKRFELKLRSNFSLPRIMALLLSVVALFLVIASPVALRWLSEVRGFNWVSLSNIGQTYGAISALLSTLALGGVAISILYQARDVKAGRIQANRTFHNELLKMEAEDPSYMAVIAAPARQGTGITSYEELRQDHFIHMWVSYWEDQYVLGEMSDSSAQYLASNELFRSAAGRRYWSATRVVKLENYSGKLLRFAKILDNEYKRAISSGPPVEAAYAIGKPCQKPSLPLTTLSRSETRLLLGALIGAFLVGRIAGRRFGDKS